MSKRKPDQWWDVTWNPCTGCEPISEGCLHCWAQRMTERNLWGYDFTPRLHEDRVYQPWHWRKPRRVFTCGMGDIFHESITHAQRDEIWAVMGCCEQPDMRKHTFMVLTKRPKVALQYTAHRARSGMVFALPNVWLGVSVENQRRADERIPVLLEIPAAVRFLSVEPMLSAVDLSPWLCPEGDVIDWVICGAETGPGKRPMNLDWARSLRDQCVSAGVPFWFKRSSTGEHTLDGATWEQVP